MREKTGWAHQPQWNRREQQRQRGVRSPVTRTELLEFEGKRADWHHVRGHHFLVPGGERRSCRGTSHLSADIRCQSYLLYAFYSKMIVGTFDGITTSSTTFFHLRVLVYADEYEMETPPSDLLDILFRLLLLQALRRQQVFSVETALSGLDTS